jgi:hypothetical protein
MISGEQNKDGIFCTFEFGGFQFEQSGSDGRR